MKRLHGAFSTSFAVGCMLAALACPGGACAPCPACASERVLEPLLRETYQPYAVSGTCEKELSVSLSQHAPRWGNGSKYDSITRWKVGWTYGYDRSDGSCSADAFQLKVDVSVSLPEWTDRGAAGQLLVEKWDAYLGHLIQHEQGHLDRVLLAVRELNNAVAELPSAKTCEHLDREIVALCRTRLSTMLEDQDVYDRETDHGLAQGVVFP